MKYYRIHYVRPNDLPVQNWVDRPLPGNKELRAYLTLSRDDELTYYVHVAESPDLWDNAVWYNPVGVPISDYLQARLNAVRQILIDTDPDSLLLDVDREWDYLERAKKSLDAYLAEVRVHDLSVVKLTKIARQITDGLPRCCDTLKAYYKIKDLLDL